MGGWSPRAAWPAGRRIARRALSVLAVLLSISARAEPSSAGSRVLARVLGPSAAAAGPAGSAAVPASPERPSLDLPETERTPVIDGVLAPEEWSGAAVLDLGYQIDPGDDTAPSERTEVLLMRTPETLYVAFRAHDGEPGAVRGRVVRRDNLSGEDFVALFLDTYDDRQRAYALYFNPLGIQADGIYTESTSGEATLKLEDSVDFTWDGIFQSRGSIGDDGYVVEAAIPFKSLRFAAGEGRRWGLHVQRWIARRSERDSWAPLSRAVSGFLVQMGSLGGLDGIYTGRTVDLIPTVTLSRSGERTEEGSLHYVDKLDPGLTANWALSPHLVLSAAVNPDFSQVESDDPQIVVSQRFPLFYPEKRPFFLEGSEVFQPAQPSGSAVTMVDTRTIVDPDWGAKLTGKLGRFAIGLIAASDRAPGLRAEYGEPGHGRSAEFTILRLRRDVSEDSALGLFVNNWRFAGASNTVLEADGRLRITRALGFAFQAAGSRTEDEEGRSRNGGFTFARLAYGGERWKVLVSDKYVSDQYRNEAGFVRRTGIHGQFGQLLYDYRPSGSAWLVALQPFANVNYLRTSRGSIDESYLGQGMDALFPKGITASFLVVTQRDHFAGLSFRYRFWQIGCEVERFRHFSFSAYAQTGGAVNYDPADPVVGDQLQLTFDGTLKPSERLTSEFIYLKARLTDRHGGGLLYSQNIYRNHTNYQFTRATAARLIVEYDSYALRLASSLLFSYVPQPNTTAYAGYGDVRLNGDDPFSSRIETGYPLLQRTFFVKLSYNIRL